MARLVLGVADEDHGLHCGKGLPSRMRRHFPFDRQPIDADVGVPIGTSICCCSTPGFGLHDCHIGLYCPQAALAPAHETGYTCIDLARTSETDGI